MGNNLHNMKVAGCLLLSAATLPSLTSCGNVPLAKDAPLTAALLKNNGQPHLASASLGARETTEVTFLSEGCPPGQCAPSRNSLALRVTNKSRHDAAIDIARVGGDVVGDALFGSVGAALLRPARTNVSNSATGGAGGNASATGGSSSATGGNASATGGNASAHQSQQQQQQQQQKNCTPGQGESGGGIPPRG